MSRTALLIGGPGGRPLVGLPISFDKEENGQERIRSGSISLGSSIVKKLKRFKKGGAPIYVQVNDKDINVVTPYGKNIFRVDDKMAKKFCKEDRFYIDFFYKDIDMEHRNLGRFKIKFRVISLG